MIGNTLEKSMIGSRQTGKTELIFFVNARDVAALRSCGADAVIIGSAGTSVVERNLAAPEQIPTEFEKLVRDFASVCTPTGQPSHPSTMTAYCELC